MRIVHVVCSDGFAGVERYIASLSVGLAERGIDVLVIGGSPVAMPAALAGSSVRWRPGGSMRAALSELRRAGLTDVINTHMSQADLIGVLHRATRRGGALIPLVSTRHFGSPRGSNALTRWLFAALGQRITAQLSISRFVADNVDGQSDVVYTGVSVAERVELRQPFVLVAQRLEPEKCTDLALRAWAQSKARNEGWTLRIAGEGSERARLEALAGELGISATTEFLGYRTDIDWLLRRAGAVLAPTPREGLGISVLEAMATATPVVAAGGGGHLETVGAVAPDLLFVPGDAGQAALIIDGLISDATRRGVLGERLRELQLRTFTLESQVEHTVALYERVAS